MKALVKSKSERGIWMEDIPAPAVGHNDVLIKVSRTAISGTDIHMGFKLHSVLEGVSKA